MTYEEFETKYLTDVLNNLGKNIRKGQALFNYLYEIKPNMANEIRGTNTDCFHNDRLIPKTLKHLREQWNNYPN